MILEPCGDAQDVLIGGAKQGAELIGCEPVVEIGGLGVDLIGHQFFKGSFLFGAPLEDQYHALHWQFWLDHAAVKFRSRRRMNISVKGYAFCFVDRLNNA